MSPTHDHSERHGEKERRPARPPAIVATPGDRYLGPSGYVWTVETVTPRGHRIVITRPTPHGQAAAIIDPYALGRMIPWTRGARESLTKETPSTDASSIRRDISRDGDLGAGQRLADVDRTSTASYPAASSPIASR